MQFIILYLEEMKYKITTFLTITLTIEKFTQKNIS